MYHQTHCLVGGLSGVRRRFRFRKRRSHKLVAPSLPLNAHQHQPIRAYFVNASIHATRVEHGQRENKRLHANRCSHGMPPVHSIGRVGCVLSGGMVACAGSGSPLGACVLAVCVARFVHGSVLCCVPRAVVWQNMAT